MTAQLWSWWASVFTRKSGRRPARRPASVRLEVEALEDRALPSTTALPRIPVGTPVYHSIDPSPNIFHIPIPTGGGVLPPPKGPGSGDQHPRVVVLPSGFVFSVLDTKNHPITSYRGTVQLTVIDARTGYTVSNSVLGLPNSYTFTARDAGSHNFRVTVPRGTWTVKIVDTANAQIHGSVTFSVVSRSIA